MTEARTKDHGISVNRLGTVKRRALPPGSTTHHRRSDHDTTLYLSSREVDNVKTYLID